MATLFEKITKDKKSLAEYLLKCCDNPISEVNQDMCDFCAIPDTEQECDESNCIAAIINGLDSKVTKNAEVVKMTNADKIRSMSDEDLAINMMCPNENGLGQIECYKSDSCNCYDCILKWLQLEAN